MKSIRSTKLMTAKSKTKWSKASPTVKKSFTEMFAPLDEPKKRDEQHLMSQTSNEARFESKKATTATFKHQSFGPMPYVDKNVTPMVDTKKVCRDRRRMTVTDRLKYNRRAAAGGSCRGHFDRKSTYDIFAAVNLAVICSLTVAIFGMVLYLTKEENIWLINERTKTVTEYCQMAEGQCYYSAKWYVDDCTRHVCQSLYVNVTVQLDETGDPATNVSAYFKLIFEPLTPINVYRKTPSPSDRVIRQDAWETDYGPTCKLPDGAGFGRCSVDGKCYPTLPGYYDRDLDVYVREAKPTIGRWSEPTLGPVKKAAAKTTTTTEVCENQDIRVSVRIRASNNPRFKLYHRSCTAAPAAVGGSMCWRPNTLYAGKEISHPYGLPWLLKDARPTVDDDGFDDLDCARALNHPKILSSKKYECSKSRIAEFGKGTLFEAEKSAQFRPCCLKTKSGPTNVVKGRCFLGLCLAMTDDPELTGNL